MKRRFLLPLAVALALHALLLFGFRRGPAPVVCHEPDLVSVLPPPDAIRLEPPLVRDDQDPPLATQAKPAEPRPVLPEPPVREVLPDITIPREAPNVTPTHSTATIPTGPFSGPGDKFGPGGLGPIRSDRLDNVPRTRAQVAPVYPYEARKSGLAGEVFVEFIVDESGRVLDPHVMRSNDPLFEEPTLRAVAKWRFEPGRKNGRVVRFRMAVPVTFAVNP